MNARIAALSVWESTLWVATDRGLVYVDGRSGTVIRRWDDLSGLPSSLVYAVAPTPGGAWAATARGLAFAHKDQPSRSGRNNDADSLILSEPVRALVTRGDTLWIGSERGLLILLPGANEARRLGSAGTDSRLTRPITAVATADSVLVFATTSDEVVAVHTRTGAVLDAGTFTTTSVGRINALAMDANTLWIAGERGMVVVRRDTRAQRTLVVGRDIPSEAVGVVLTPQYAWIATRDGGVRVTRLSDGMVR